MSAMSCIELPRTTEDPISGILQKRIAAEAKRVSALKVAVLDLASLGCQCSHDCTKDTPGLYCRKVKQIFSLLEKEVL